MMNCCHEVMRELAYVTIVILENGQDCGYDTACKFTEQDTSAGSREAPGAFHGYGPSFYHRLIFASRKCTSQCPNPLLNLNETFY